LWTIPYELECYIAISVLSILGFRRNPRIFLIVLLCATLILTFLNFEYFVLKEAARPSGRSVTFTFLWGVLFYLLRNEVKHNFYFFCLALVTTWLALRQTQTEYLAAPAIAYVTVYVGLLDIRRTFLLWLGDVSYGVYLYSFAIQQAVYQLLPEYRSWHENFIISIVVSCAVGYLSWHLVELPVLNKKREVIQFTMSLPEKLGLLMRKAMGR
jgi:peptidoglycan/LPS O-acetylase OafA/YrhL